MTNEEAIFDLEQFSFSPIGEGDLHTESVELALSALREQAEHDKGCEICNGKLPCDNGCDGFCDICNVPDVYRTVHKTGHYNYCPMCGRRLEAQHE